MFQHIKDLVELDDSGPKAWKLLRDVIQPNTLPMVIVLEKELAALSMKPGDGVKPVLDKIKDIYARMAAAGSEVSQMQQCTKIISVLDNSWDNLIPTLNVQQDKWTPEWLRQQILQEDFRRRHTGGGAANKTAEGYGAAGGSRGRGGGRGRGRGRGFGRGRGRGDYNEGHVSSGGRGSTRMEGACWYCKKAGHPWFKCFSRHEGWAPPGMKPPSGERARGDAVQGSGAQGDGAQGKADPGMFLMVEDVQGSGGDVGSVGKVVMHPLTHWVIDSGCTSHMTPRADLLDEVKPPRKIKFVVAASGDLLPVIGVGNAKVMGANGELVGLGNVLLVEGLSANLLSVRRLQKSKAEVTFGPTSCRAKLGKLLLWNLEEKSSCIKDLWQLPIIPWKGKPPATAKAAAAAKATAGGEEIAPTAGALDAVKKVQQPQQPYGELLAGVDATGAWAKASSGNGEADWETWHERLCHVNIPMLQKLVKDGCLKGLEVKGGATEIGSCPTCLETKFTKFPFSSSTGPAKAPLALVHMDVVGPTRALSLSGSRYFLTIVDDHTRAVWVYPLKTKGEVAAAVLKEWMPRAQRESGHKVKVIRTDNGGEFIGADFEKVLKRKGIQHQLTVPYNPQQNGVAERFNRTLQEGARTLLGRAGLPDPFWVTALRQVVVVKNQVLATVGDKQWVPYTKWYGSAPAVNMLRTYGCMVVFHVPKEKRGKQEASGRWDSEHFANQCPDRVNMEAGDGQEAPRGRLQNHQPRCETAYHKDKKHSDSKDKQPSDAGTSRGKSAKEAPSDDVHHDGQPSCSMVGVVKDASAEPTISLAPEAGEDFQAVAAAVQENSAVVLLNSGCSHHLMGMREAFVEMNAEEDVHHVRGFNGAIQPVQGHGTSALQVAAGTKVIILDVLYVPGIQANLLSAGQLKDSGVQFQDTGDETLLVSAEGAVLGRACYTGRVLCTDLRPCSSPQPSVPPTETVALRTIASSTRSSVDIWHVRLAHAGMDTIKRTAAHGAASGLEITSSFGADLVCVSCVGGKLVRHTFPDQGSEPKSALDAVHIDVCGPFQVATKDGSRYLRLLKDRKTRFVWMCTLTWKSDALEKFETWLTMVERQCELTVKMIRSDRGGEFLGGDFTAFLDKRCIVHDQTCPYTPQHNGMAEREIRTLVEAGLHLSVSPTSKGWEVLDLAANRIITTVEVIFYETQSLDDWKAERAPGSVHKVSTSAVSAPSLGLLADEIDDPLDALASAPATPLVPTSISCSTLPPVYPRVVPVTKPSTSSAPAVISSPLPAAESISRPTPDTLSKSADDNEGRHDALPSAPRIGIVDGRPAASSKNGVLDVQKHAGERLTGEQISDGSSSDVVEVIGEDNNDAGESSGDSSSSDVVEFKLLSQHSTPSNFGVPPKKWADVCLVFANSILDDVNADTTLPELDPDIHADPERWWDISTMTVKKALASWKGKAMKAAMEEEMRSLLANGTWELVPRLRGVNVMKNRWVLTTKYNTDDTVAREKARLVVKGFTQIYGADYDETYSPVGSYVMLRIFLSIVAVLDLHIMQPTYFNDAGCWLLVYVDNLLAASSSLEMLKDLRELLQNGFEPREITPVQKYLGLEIVRDRSARKLWLHQSAYVDKLRRCFVDEELTIRCPKTPISVDAYTELTFNNEEYQAREEEEYRQKVGSLQFAATSTRPDIGYECSKLGLGLTIRNDQHERELDCCIHYMVNTRDFALEFGGGPDTLRLVGYADSDDAGDRQTRSSTNGYIFVLGGAAFSWASHRIKCMTLSLTESEYIAATEAGKEARRSRFLLAEFRLLDDGVPTVIHVDNSSAIAVAEGLGIKGSLKHMERRYIWLQQMVKRKKLALTYIPTSEQPADYLTKALHAFAFKRCSVAVGQVDLVDDERDNEQE
ncbi:unnamed protein product [Closterium sp. NIES-53]